KGLGAQLPMPTVIVIALSNFIADFWWLIGGVIFGTMYFLRRYHETYKGRRVLDGILLKAPILGMLLRKIAVARFCRTLSTLIAFLGVAIGGIVIAMYMPMFSLIGQIG